MRELGHQWVQSDFCVNLFSRSEMDQQTEAVGSTYILQCNLHYDGTYIAVKTPRLVGL